MAEAVLIDFVCMAVCLKAHPHCAGQGDGHSGLTVVPNMKYGVCIQSERTTSL